MRRKLTSTSIAVTRSHCRNPLRDTLRWASPGGKSNIARYHRRFAGFTLTEVVVASGLLIIAVVPILKALTIAQATSITIERKTRSLVLAQGKLEEIRARSIYHYMSSFDESSVSLSGSYLCNVSDNEHPSLRTITVSVGYDVNGDSNLSSGEILVTLTTCVAKRWPAS